MRSDDLAAKVAMELRAELARRRQSVRQLSHHVNMPTATVTRWLNAETAITLEGLSRICRSLGIPLAEMVARAENAPITVAPVSTTPGPGGATGG